MAFTSQQTKRLSRALPSSAIKTRHIDGFEMRYIEGWFAIDEANRVFGFDGCSRENLSVSCLSAKAAGNIFVVNYICRIRIRIGSGELFRDGTGFGAAQASTLGQAHEQAVKTAETDATKRAFVTFGKRFGLQLYAPRPETPPVSTTPTPA